MAASDAVLDDKPTEKATMDGQPHASYAQARLADMVFRAKLRRLEFDTRQGPQAPILPSAAGIIT